eukprot:gene3566-4010_t
MPVLSRPDRGALAELDTKLEKVSADLPGLVATVVYGDHTWFKGYGKRNFTDPTSPPPSPADLVRIASITKTFTSLLAFQGRDQGHLSLDDVITKFLPSFKVKQRFPTSHELTLRMLASHNSGLPRETPLCAFDPTCNESKILGAIADSYTVLPPYTRFHYSNLGLSLLGHCTERAFPGNARYEDLVPRHILSPLGSMAIHEAHAASMLSTFDPDMQRTAVGKGDEGRAAPVEPLGWDNPCGGLMASASDMARYMRYLLNPESNPAPAVDPATMSEYFTMTMPLRDGPAAIGLPWEYSYLPVNGSEDVPGVWVSTKQ